MNAGILLIIIHIHLSVSIDDGSSWLIGQLIGHCCSWNFCGNVCCVFSFIYMMYIYTYIYIYIILLLKTAQNVFKNEHNEAWFGITVLWSVVMAYTIVITVACSGADDKWQFGVYKNICYFAVVTLFRFFKEKKKQRVDWYSIYLLIDLFLNVFVQKGVLLLIISAIKLNWHTVTLQIHCQY